MAESLRDQLAQALETHVPNSEEAPATSGTVSDAPVETGATPASEPKPGRTAGRARDEHGRLLPGKPVKEPAAEPGRTATPAQSPEQSATATPAAEPKPFPQRPSSWKKEMWPIWDKLAKGEPLTGEEARAHAEYIGQREGEFSKGVSTYKAEADKAKAVWEAIAPFQPTLQQYGIDPVNHIKALFNAHQMLALGTPEQRLGMFVKLAQDYKIPLQSMFVQGQDGQIYFNPQLQQQQQAPQQFSSQQIEQLIARQTEQRFQQYASEQQVASFLSAKDAQGNSQYPHFEQVRETMAQLLESKLADDLPSAYQAAIRLPQHSEIWDAQQEQQRANDEAERKRKAADAAKTARANAVSPASRAPTGPTAGQAKGLRAQIEEAADSVLSGRV